ncbi:hypothetical protein [Streptomyces sp. NPDC053560]|uniref:hypothetical protein n=1 Tax=Streptomyces sp. NPDC053560 TaxID=3365711 RepID=UPI0037D57204
MRVAEDQLAQSREDQEKTVRKQASQVTSWVERRPKGLVRVVENRSADPISSVQLDYEWTDPKATERLAEARADSLSDITDGGTAGGAWRKLLQEDSSSRETHTQVLLEETFLAVKSRYLGQIPPCSRVEVKPPVRDVGLRFTDSQKSHWLRTSEGELRPVTPDMAASESLALGYSRAGLLQAAPSEVIKFECGESERP